MTASHDVPVEVLAFDPGDDPAGYARLVLESARPVDRRRRPAVSSAADFVGVPRARQLRDFFGAQVPGSGAWDSMFAGAVASKADLGFDVGEAAVVLSAGLRARSDGDDARCAALGEDLLLALDRAPSIAQHTALSFEWRPPAQVITRGPGALPPDWEQRVWAGWTGQIAGAAFGTPLEGCTGDALAGVYGPINRYVCPPDTLNDDCVYELVALDVLEAVGGSVTSQDLARAWHARIPFGWSAEWVALENLRRGIVPPRSGWAGNPMHDWIGAQMRTMVYGLVAPAWPHAAARLATLDASISHARNGIDGGVFSAVLTSLAFEHREPRALLLDTATWFASLTSEYADVLRSSLDVCGQTNDVDVARIELLTRLERRYWVHAFPNLAAVVVALWFGDGDVTRSMAILARCGLDVDCNAGLVGTVLGVLNASVPSWWANPIEGRIDTYLPDLPSITIDEVVGQTLRLAGSWRDA